MRIKKFLITLFFLLGLSFLFPHDVFAQAHDCFEQTNSFNLTIDPPNANTGDPINFTVTGGLAGNCENKYVILCTDITTTSSGEYLCSNSYDLWLDASCNSGPFTLQNGFSSNGTHTATLLNGYLAGINSLCSNTASVEISGGASQSNCAAYGQYCCIDERGGCLLPDDPCCNVCEESPPLYCDFTDQTVKQSDVDTCGWEGIKCCTTANQCFGDLEPNDSGSPNCTCVATSTGCESQGYLCALTCKPECQESLSCSTGNVCCNQTCMTGGGGGGGSGGGASIKFTCNGETGVDSAIGCIPIDSVVALAGFIIAWAIGIGSGIAFLLMLYAGYMIMTSSGDPRKLMAAKELFVSAMAGLIMLVFVVYIIRIIGFDILGVMGL